MICLGANASEVSMGARKEFALFEDVTVSFQKIVLLINLTKLFFIGNAKVSFVSNLLDLSQVLSEV